MMLVRGLRRLFYIAIVAVFTLPLSAPFAQNTSALSGSSFNPGRIIDNSVFFTKDALSVSSIQSTLTTQFNYFGSQTCDSNGSTSISYHYNSSSNVIGNSNDPTVTTSRAYYTWRAYYAKYPSLLTPSSTYDNDPFDQTKPSTINYKSSTEDPWFVAHAHFVCLANFQQPVQSVAADSYCDAVNGSSMLTTAQIIYRVSHACNINAKVLIVLLEKEEGLVTDSWPWSTQYRIATGYGCPDTSACDSTYYGFFNQVYNAAHQYERYAIQPTQYTYTANAYNNIYYNPTTSCGSEKVFISNQATADLYNYTPYVPNAAALNNLYGSGDSCSSYGNRNFWVYFNDWFGNPTPSPCNDAANLSGKLSGREIFASHHNSSSPSYLTYAQMNNTGSGCTEVHSLNSGYTAWQSHSTTLLPATDPTTATLIPGDMNGDGDEELLYVVYSGPGGKVNIRSLSLDYRSYSGLGASTPITGFSPSSAEFLTGDMDGAGRDQLLYLVYSSVGGAVNIRTLNSSYTGYTGFGAKTPITNYDPTKAMFLPADLNGDGRDELLYIVFNGPGGVVNIRIMNPTYTGYVGSGVRTPFSGSDLAAGKAELIAGDMNGDGKDELLYVVYDGPGGKVNIRTLNSNLSGYAGYGVQTPISGYAPGT